MARTAYAAAQTIVPTGLVNWTTEAAIADGHKFANTGKQFIYVDNQNAATLTVTIQTPVTTGGLAVAEQTVALLTTEAALIGPFAPGIYNQAADGMVYVDYDIQASVTVALLQLAD